MNIDLNEMLSNNKLAFLRAFSAEYYIASLIKSNNDSKGTKCFQINTIVSKNYKNTPDRFVKVVININGAFNYIIKMQKDWVTKKK